MMFFFFNEKVLIDQVDENDAGTNVPRTPKFPFVCEQNAGVLGQDGGLTAPDPFQQFHERHVFKE